MYGGLNLLKEKSEEIQKTNGISSDFYYISIFERKQKCNLYISSCKDKLQGVYIIQYCMTLKAFQTIFPTR